jgi:hypothetical protein
MKTDDPARNPQFLESEREAHGSQARASATSVASRTLGPRPACKLRSPLCITRCRRGLPLSLPPFPSLTVDNKSERIFITSDVIPKHLQMKSFSGHPARLPAPVVFARILLAEDDVRCRGFDGVGSVCRRNSEEL